MAVFLENFEWDTVNEVAAQPAEPEIAKAPTNDRDMAGAIVRTSSEDIMLHQHFVSISQCSSSSALFRQVTSYNKLGGSYLIHIIIAIYDFYDLKFAYCNIYSLSLAYNAIKYSYYRSNMHCAVSDIPGNPILYIIQ